MENNSYHPYVTERIRRFDGAPIGACYSASFIHSEQERNALLHGSNIITQHYQLADTAELIIIPLTGNSVQSFLRNVDNYSCLQHENVRLAINYATLRQAGNALCALASRFSFWLYDVAPPGTEWKNITDFPFSGIVLSDEFFSENYLKFSFPFLLASLRETQAEVILRTPQLQLPAETYRHLALSGWQSQRDGNPLFAG
ncbi:hypothetical protein ACWXWB_10500 [Pantoea dispersa]|uniref:hypothetical protein n=1 Tax=Pantoea dispersa TaxID=59814 RepID=UPI002DB98410|nr:hypothetical protein [Pantoea dispersa]MEB5972198.1 hypothetical protein [Pantoea dispersa]